MTKVNLGYLPLDNRPVNRSFVERISEAIGIDLVVPPLELLGNLKQTGTVEALQSWFAQEVRNWVACILALDTWSFGGLIPSRLDEQPIEQLESQLHKLFKVIPQNLQLYAFSSITRTPNYNSSEEEPDYWSLYGKALHTYSVKAHQLATTNHSFEQVLKPDLTLAKELDIPVTILNDWLNRRLRRWQYHQKLVEACSKGCFKSLVFCQDDTGEFGFSSAEAKALRSLISKGNLEKNCWVQTGADELALTLVAKQQLDTLEEPPKLYLNTTHRTGFSTQLPFDGANLETITKQRLTALGLNLTENKTEADLWSLIHTPQTVDGVGDHCIESPANVAPEEQANIAFAFMEEGNTKNKPLILADVSYANGADTELMQRLSQTVPHLMSKLYGYGAWNTPGNALGCALAMGVLRWVSELGGRLDEKKFQEALFVRLADDWLYQSKWRQILRKQTHYNFGAPDTLEAIEPERIQSLMAEDLQRLQSHLGLENINPSLSFPCGRTFEISINLTN